MSSLRRSHKKNTSVPLTTQKGPLRERQRSPKLSHLQPPILGEEATGPNVLEANLHRLNFMCVACIRRKTNIQLSVKYYQQNLVINNLNLIIIDQDL